MTDILAQEKPKSIKLADGKDYTLPPIDLTTLANIEKTMGVGGRALILKMEAEPLQTIQLFTYDILRETCPELTKEQAGRLVTIREIPLFSETITSIMAISS